MWRFYQPICGKCISPFGECPLSASVCRRRATVTCHMAQFEMSIDETGRTNRLSRLSLFPGSRGADVLAASIFRPNGPKIEVRMWYNHRYGNKT